MGRCSKQQQLDGNDWPGQSSEHAISLKHDSARCLQCRMHCSVTHYVASIVPMSSPSVRISYPAAVPSPVVSSQMRTPTQISRPPANAPRNSPTVGLQRQPPVNNTSGAQRSSSTPHNNRYLQGVQGSISMHRQNLVEKDERAVRPSIASVDRKSARRLPLSWLSIVPECKIYNKLVSMEATLEQSRIQKLREWSNTSKTSLRRIARICICNTYMNQSGQARSADNVSGSSGSFGPPAWNLYVVGKILGEKSGQFSLHDYLEKV